MKEQEMTNGLIQISSLNNGLYILLLATVLFIGSIIGFFSSRAWEKQKSQKNTNKEIEKIKDSLFDDDNFILLVLSSALICSVILLLEIFHGKEKFDWLINTAGLSGFLILIYIWNFRSIQTNEQMNKTNLQIEKNHELYKLTNQNVNFTNYYKHKEYFIEHVNNSIKLVATNYNVQEGATLLNPLKLYKVLFPNSSYENFDISSKESTLFEYIRQIDQGLHELEDLENKIGSDKYTNEELLVYLEYAFQVSQIIAQLLIFEVNQESKLQIKRVNTTAYKETIEYIKNSVIANQDLITIYATFKTLALVPDLAKFIIQFSPENKEAIESLNRISRILLSAALAIHNRMDLRSNN